MKSGEHFLKQKTRVSRWRAMETLILAVVFLLLAGPVANASTLTVTTASDDVGAVLSLRAAIAQAVNGDTINFDESLAGQKILLTQGQLTIDKDLTISGPGAFYLTIDGNLGGNHPTSRIFGITSGNVVAISGLTITRGNVGRPNTGSGILNEGTLALSDCIVSSNGLNSAGFGSGISNIGTLSISRCTVKNNGAGDAIRGGGILNIGRLTIEDSTIRDNRALSGGGIFNDGTLTVVNTTVSGNVNGTGFGGAGAGMRNAGVVTLINSTVSGNQSQTFGGGIETSEGDVQLQNTIVAGNTARTSDADCSGTITSLGHNIIGTIEGCTVALDPSDQVGDPVLGAFLDPGSPGNGRFPLRSDSPAIDSGDNNACAALDTDQLGQPRTVAGSVPLGGARICDRGSVEFFPSVNQLVKERESERVTQFDPTPVPGAPAGTFLIVAKFDNISDNAPPVPGFVNQTIFSPFFEVAALQLQRQGATEGDQPILLNADGGPGRVGARLVPQGNLTTPLDPGATGTFQFLIGLQKAEPFGFFVNMLGEPRSALP